MQTANLGKKASRTDTMVASAADVLTAIGHTLEALSQRVIKVGLEAQTLPQANDKKQQLVDGEKKITDLDEALKLWEDVTRGLRNLAEPGSQKKKEDDQ